MLGGCLLFSNLGGLSDGDAADAATERAADDAEVKPGPDATSDADLRVDAAAGADADASDPCAPRAGEIVLTTLNQSQTLPLDFANAPKLPLLESKTNECPVNANTADPMPARTVIVLNATGADARLSAWGACTAGNDEVNVVFYARETVPTTPSELALCVEASVAYGGATSPQSGGSGYCHGLTLANGHALPLKACARAVVIFQHDTNPLGPGGPPAAKVELD
jgi:hypothetical protein